MADSVRPLAGKNPRKIFPGKAYFSYWSYNLYKTCPKAFDLTVLQSIRLDKKKEGVMDHGYIAVGTIPHNISEIYFADPPGQRNPEIFNEWHPMMEEFLEDHWVDWETHTHQDMKTAIHTCTKNLWRLIQENDLVEREVLSEENFVQHLDNKLVIGGRVDLIVKVDENLYDILDIKATLNPSRLNKEQLLIYKLGLEASGRKVRNVGYLLLRQGRRKDVRVTEAEEYQIKKVMRNFGERIESKEFPANYTWRSCKWCDVKNHCETYKVNTANNQFLSPTQPGVNKF